MSKWLFKEHKVTFQCKSEKDLQKKVNVYQASWEIKPISNNQPGSDRLGKPTALKLRPCALRYSYGL